VRAPAAGVVAASLVAIALGLAGCAPAGPGSAAPGATASTAPPPAPSAPAVPVAPATPAPARVAVPPVAVTVPSVDVAVPVIEVGVDDVGAMELPVDPAVAGWYRFGADPSLGEGSTVISAHVDAPAYPIGPFSRLRELAAGAEVTVDDASGAAHRYAVESVAYYRKTDLPVDDLFAREGEPRLVLITCGGAFDPSTGRYEDNVVTVARPLA
jgi:LPXTG-site transpeptidase (sortase) family protein